MEKPSKTYQLSPTYYAAIRRRFILIAVPIVIASAVVGYLAGATQGTGIIGALITALAMTAFLAFSLSNNYRRQRQAGEGYKLVVQGNAITRVQAGKPDINLTRNGIARITEQPGKGLGIFGRNEALRFGIPASLEGYGEVREMLAGWRDIETLTPQGIRWQAWTVPAMAAVIVILFAVVVISNDKIVVTVTGLVAMTVCLLSALYLVRSPQVNVKMKSRIWMMGIPLVALAAKVAYTLLS